MKLRDLRVPAVRYRDLSSTQSGDKSYQIRKRVQKAREIHLNRFTGNEYLFCNADMKSRDILKYCRLDQNSQEILQTAITQLGLSARAYDRILKVSRTIDNLTGENNIKPDHISEAIQYRSLDRKLWL